MDFFEFLGKAYTPYHTTALLKEYLASRGFEECKETEPYSLSLGGKYFVVRADASLIAFCVPDVLPVGFQIAAAHNDSPALFVTGEKRDQGYVRLTVEKYGGPHTATWLDRPLKLAGRVFLNDCDKVSSHLFAYESPLYIPTVAPHLHKEAETRVLNNPAADLLPIFSKDDGSPDALKRKIASHFSVSTTDIAAYDLYLTSAETPTLWGDGFVSSPRLDDLACVYGLLSGFVQAKPTSAVSVLAIFNGEEVGSLMPEAADASFLSDTLARVSQALSRQKECLLARSFMISADNAHAVHPAHPELLHPTQTASLGEGIVIKYAASRRYTTDAFSASMTKLLCQMANVPVQEFRNRADLPGGGTLGALSGRHVSIPSVDIGLAQLSMHSACETGALSDVKALEDMAKCYYSCVLTYTENGAFWHK